MSDDRLNGDDSQGVGATRTSATQMGATPPVDAHTGDFDLSSLFVHGQDEDQAVLLRDEVGALFAEPPPRTATASWSTDELPTGLFAEVARPATPARVMTTSRPIPFPHAPEHAAPTYRMTRVQLIAMGVGVVVTLAGAGWALATPTVPVPTVVAAPAATVDPERVAKVGDEVDALAAAVQAAQTSATSAAAPLAAMAGYSDEPARVAAEAARQAYVSALGALKLPAKTGTTARNAALDQQERDIAAAQSALTTATGAFRAAIASFTQALPAYAATAIADNADADESLRAATTQAAATVAGTDPFGTTAFTTWDQWRTTLSALVADQARVVAERNASESGGTDGSGSPTPTQPTTAPEPTTPPVTDPSPTPETPTDPGTVIPPTLPAG